MSMAPFNDMEFGMVKFAGIWVAKRTLRKLYFGVFLVMTGTTIVLAFVTKRKVENKTLTNENKQE